MRSLLRRFARNRSGATAVEYALIVGFLSLAIVGGLRPVADQLEYLWGNSASKLNSAWKD